MERKNLTILIPEKTAVLIAGFLVNFIAGWLIVLVEAAALNFDFAQLIKVHGVYSFRYLSGWFFPSAVNPIFLYMGGPTLYVLGAVVARANLKQIIYAIIAQAIIYFVLNKLARLTLRQIFKSPVYAKAG